jgi:predicted amidophosphoribosyltransferase
VTAVPMHWLRRLARGTSAAETLAAVVARELGVSCVRSLRRVRATTMQNALPPHERPANVRTAFRVVVNVRGKRVLLVDDVVTTGATASACSQVLLAAGAREVYLAAVAKAGHTEVLASL